MEHKLHILDWKLECLTLSSDFSTPVKKSFCYAALKLDFAVGFLLKKIGKESVQSLLQFFWETLLISAAGKLCCFPFNIDLLKAEYTKQEDVKLSVFTYMDCLISYILTSFSIRSLD